MPDVWISSDNELQTEGFFPNVCIIFRSIMKCLPNILKQTIGVEGLDFI